jgi:pentose-5-phosphate-3-epimerase
MSNVYTILKVQSIELFCYNLYMIIYPSILEKNSEDLFFQIKRLSPYFNTFQIDIADGVDVPSKTVQIEEIQNFLQQSNNETMKRFSFEFHLMVKDYKTEIKKLEKLKSIINIRDILIHGALLPDLSILHSLCSIPIGLVLYPEDPVSLLTPNPYLLTVPYVQIISCRTGFQGSPFIEESLNKIQQLREANYRNKISLDGGINEKTLPIIMSKKYKPDILCPGSFLTKTEDLEKNINKLSRCCE